MAGIAQEETITQKMYMFPQSSWLRDLLVTLFIIRTLKWLVQISSETALLNLDLRNDLGGSQKIVQISLFLVNNQRGLKMGENDEFLRVKRFLLSFAQFYYVFLDISDSGWKCAKVYLIFYYSTSK